MLCYWTAGCSSMLGAMLQCNSRQVYVISRTRPGTHRVVFQRLTHFINKIQVFFSPPIILETYCSTVSRSQTIKKSRDNPSSTRSRDSRYGHPNRSPFLHPNCRLSPLQHHSLHSGLHPHHHDRFRIRLAYRPAYRSAYSGKELEFSTCDGTNSLDGFDVHIFLG